MWNQATVSCSHGSIGFNGTGFDISTCVALYRTFIRPVMEYGLALIERVQFTAIRKMLSMGNRAIMIALTGLESARCRSMDDPTSTLAEYNCDQG